MFSARTVPDTVDIDRYVVNARLSGKHGHWRLGLNWCSRARPWRRAFADDRPYGTASQDAREQNNEQSPQSTHHKPSPSERTLPRVASWRRDRLLTSQLCAFVLAIFKPTAAERLEEAHHGLKPGESYLRQHVLLGEQRFLDGKQRRLIDRPLMKLVK